MKQTSNLQRPMLNIEPSEAPTTSDIKHRRSHISLANSRFCSCRVFIYAGSQDLRSGSDGWLTFNSCNSPAPWPIFATVASKPRSIRQRHRQLQNFAVAGQCRARVLSSVAGNFLCARALCSDFCIVVRLSILTARSWSSRSPLLPRKFADSTSPAAVSVTPANTGVSRLISRPISQFSLRCLRFYSKQLPEADCELRSNPIQSMRSARCAAISCACWSRLLRDEANSL